MTCAWLLVALLATAVCGGLGQGDGDALTPAVAEGVSVLRAWAQENVGNVEALRDAVATGELEGSKAAYEAGRPLYERIEVLANSFGDTDSDIDARAYSFDNGEAIEGVDDLSEPGALFKGFHRIEALLFRNENITAAACWIDILLESSNQLVADLGVAENFSPTKSFVGMIGLSTEVGAKKMSSEEETFSDLSILIYHNNFLGIQSQFTPFDAALRAANVEVADNVTAAFDEALASVAPYFTTAEDGTTTYTAYSQVSIESRAKIQTAAYNLADALTAARDALMIPDEDEEEAEEACDPVDDFDMTSEPIMAGLDYFRALMPFQQGLVTDLREAVESGDVDAAKLAYTRARPIYEQIEVLATSFPVIDSDIDARPYSFKFGEFDEDFKGFHELERWIFRDARIDAAAIETAKGLEQSHADLEVALTGTSDPKAYTGFSVFEGVIGLSTEVMSRKISSEEELFTDLSLLIFYNNWKGIYSQASPFLPLASPETKDLLDSTVTAAVECLNITIADDILDVSAASVDQAFVDALIDGDYGKYSEVDNTGRECITERGYAVRDAVTTLAHELELFPECSAFHPNAYFDYRHHS